MRLHYVQDIEKILFRNILMTDEVNGESPKPEKCLLWLATVLILLVKLLPIIWLPRFIPGLLLRRKPK